MIPIKRQLIQRFCDLTESKIESVKHKLKQSIALNLNETNIVEPGH